MSCISGNFEPGVINHKWQNGDNDGNTSVRVILDKSQLDATGTGEAPAYRHGFDNSTFGLRIKSIFVLALFTLNAYSILNTVTNFSKLPLIVHIGIAAGTSYMGLTMIYNTARAALMPLYVLARTPFSEHFTVKMAGQECVRSLQNIVRAPFFALGATFGGLVGIFLPLQGRKIISTMERKWNRKANLADSIFQVLPMPNFRAFDTHPSSHNFYGAGCMQPNYVVRYEGGEVTSVETSTGYLHASTISEGTYESEGTTGAGWQRRFAVACWAY